MNKVQYFATNWLQEKISFSVKVQEKNSFTNLENIIKKITNAEQHIQFNDQSLQHDLLPT